MREWDDSNTPWVLAALAALAAAPALLPGGEAWGNNPPRLLEVWSLAHQVLPENHRAVGWSTLAAGGFPVGVHHAPLGGLLIALAGWAGLPVVGMWMAAIPLANAAFALGLFRLARACLRSPLAAALATLLAAAAPADLWGAGGVASGDWPARLAMGLLAAGLAKRSASPRRAGAWLAVLLLLDLRVGAAGLLWTALLSPVGLRERLLSLALGLGGSAVGWAPMLGASPALGLPAGAPLWALAAPFVPLDLDALRHGQPLAALAGSLGLASALPLVGGLLALALRRAPSREWTADQALWRRLTLLGVGLGLGSLVLVNATLLPFLRLLLALLAGAGWGLLGGRSLAFGVGAPTLAAAVGVGLVVLPLRLNAADQAVWSALEHSWADLAAAAPEGRIYVDDPTGDAEGPPLFRGARPGALSPLWTGRAELGSWDPSSPAPVALATGSEADHWLGLPRAAAEQHSAEASERLALYGIGAVLTASPWTAALMAADPRVQAISAHPPFATWRVVKPPPAELAVPADRGQVRAIRAEREAISGELRATGTAPLPFRIRRAWDPGWQASFEGAPLPLHEDETTGLIAGLAPGSGAVAAIWRAPGAWGPWVSAASLGLGLLSWALYAQRRRPWAPP